MADLQTTFTPVATPKGFDASENTKWEELPLNAALDQLGTTREGLTSKEAQRRLNKHGLNQLPEEAVSYVKVFVAFLWNPLSWAMEVAALLAIVLLDFSDFGLIIFLLLLNAIIGFLEEIQAGNAVAALKRQLAPEAKVLRDGVMRNVTASEIVPGDIIRVRLGDVIPADLKFLEGDPLQVDESSLTGESLPVIKGEGDVGLSGSIVKLGEIEAVVTTTGVHTFLGRAASQISTVATHGRLQHVLTTVGNFCLVLIVLWCVIELIVQLGGRGGENVCVLVSHGCLGVANILVLIVGGIPVAMPTVLSVTLAIGSSALAKQHAIVTRLTSVEELASMEVLCCDKTGTLTRNQLSVDVASVVPYHGYTVDDVLMYAALSARVENNEPIDVVCFHAYPGNGTLREQYTLLHYTPFDPTNKRTIAKVRDNGTGDVLRICKGAPQVVLAMEGDTAAPARVQDVQDRIDEMAVRGFRSLGVALDLSGDVPLAECRWQMIGLVPLFDPPRHDTAETVQSAMALGVAVKMVTGDQKAIAIETSRQLGLPTNILDTSLFHSALPAGLDLAQLIDNTDGFAQVFPEHKLEIVRQLQSLGKADIGVAVDDATDAARAAADIVLVRPGLGVIVTAIRMSREIFLRMKNYAMYSIAMTVRVVVTFGLLTVAWNWYFPTLLVVVLAILNDGTILTIAKDNVQPSPTPDAWKLRQVFLIAVCFGLWLSFSTVVLFAVLHDSRGFQGVGVEDLCVSCLRDDCDAFFQLAHQHCAKQLNASGCGEVDGSVIKSANLTRVSVFRVDALDRYWSTYNRQHGNLGNVTLFHRLSGNRVHALPPADDEPTALDEYQQFVYQYTVGRAGVDAALNGQGVSFIGRDQIPLTNQVSVCDYLWSYSNFNRTWTRGFQSIGPGIERKEGVLRSLVYMQVSISGQALIFVTRTAGLRKWCFMDRPSNLLLGAFIVAQVTASAIGWVGFGGYPTARVAVIGCGGGFVLIGWLWSLLWHLPLDLIKFSVWYLVDKSSEAYANRAFSSRINAGHPSMAHSTLPRGQRAVIARHSSSSVS
ncbi:TPA: hypothetical protein N0F65_001373 [Lagenidium giganteum]|uniref:Plasma membrane ATPase n=1 Tax=Lagenidium giganteum TaxID=4803 RepID=A0AAV2YZR3_9STRA|nr:TPA: hypothetical protein N0F65_001373 [Lagenidium giganteum]